MFFKHQKNLIASSLFVLMLLITMFGTTMAQAEPVVYRIAPNGISAFPCGADWTYPCDLQYALTNIVSSGSELWVMQGVYKPGFDRDSAFILKNGVEIYGGFAGTETLRTERNPITNITILSGDIGTIGDNSDNSYHVVVGSNTDNTALLDGFTVKDGNANGGTLETMKGGGMYNNLGSPTVMNTVFSDNSATFGAGMYNYGEAFEYTGKYFIPVITNVVFVNNLATEGGGVRNEHYSSPNFTNVTFADNDADRSGGGMENFDNSSPTLMNVTFKNNSSYAGGGLMNWVGNNLSLVNVTFSGNTAGSLGGGMASYSSNPSMTNVTFFGNSANEFGGGIYTEGSTSLIIQSTILWGNSAAEGAQVYDTASSSIVISDSVVQGGYVGGTNIIITDPMLGPLGNYGGITETIPLLAGSSAIDSGDDLTCPATDQRGITRPQGAHCDIGAFEYVEPTTPTPTITPEPTDTPKPTKTPRPTRTPRPTKTPKS